MKNVSTLFGPLETSPEMSRLTSPGPPAYMFPRTSPATIHDFELGMDDIRLDNHHDDLFPNPEELKTHGLVPSTPLVRKRWFRRTGAGLACLAVMAVLAIVVTSKNGGSASNDATVSSVQPEDYNMVDSRLQDTIAFLLDFVDHPHLTNTSSPQFLAARWMADVDGLRAPLDRGFLERYALVALWFATQGDQWRHNLSFLTEAHQCEWHSTFQRNDKSVFEMGVQCNERAEVKSLVLRKYYQRRCD